MKYLKVFLMVLMICSLYGCGTENNINEETIKEMQDEISQMEDEVSKMKNEIFILKNKISQMENEVTQVRVDAMEIVMDPVSCDAEQIINENNFSISIGPKDEKIRLYDTDSQKELASFDESYGSGSKLLSMSSENNGVFLYSSYLGTEIIMKHMYITSDRWQTYSQIDITFLVDGYPTSLYAQSDTCFYIGTLMKNDGYMYKTFDGGKDWFSVTINENIESGARGYAPIPNSEGDAFYALLEYGSRYALYKSDAAMSTWKQLGIFSHDDRIDTYFILDGDVIVKDNTGHCYRLSF